MRYHNKLVIGVRAELAREYDFSEWGWEARSFVELLHNKAYIVLVTYNIHDVSNWTLETRKVFVKNGINRIGQIMNMSEDGVFNLSGCNLKTRKEVYYVFKTVLNMQLTAWDPMIYYRRVLGEG